VVDVAVEDAEGVELVTEEDGVLGFLVVEPGLVEAL
jgi:hypothetical protein